MKKLYYNKIYFLLLSLTALCGYGFQIIHPVMGIDDTPYSYYFEEGLAAVAGRWVLFVLNKLFHIADFAPFITEFAAVLILMLAVTVWGTLFYSILGERISKWGYWLFSCIFLSCPLIAEVFTYYLHNGIAIGYLFCGVSLCLFRNGRDAASRRQRASAIGCFSASVATMVVAIGCYESLMIVWLAGLFMLLLAERFAGSRRNVPMSILYAVCVAFAAILLRSIIIKLVIALFGLGELSEAAVLRLRSVTEMLGWMLEPGAKSEFFMVVKRLFVMYGVFAYAYYPIAVFVASSLIICLFCLWRCIRQRDGWIPLLTLGLFVSAFLLAVVEGTATLYRSAQFLPLVCAFGMLIAAYAATGFLSGLEKRFLQTARLQRWGGHAVRLGRALFALAAASVLWNQCTDLNAWFYVDYNKYQYTKDYMCRVGAALQKDFDLSKPVIFTGQWENPKSIVKRAYVDIGSDTYYKMKRITDFVDEHLLEKFYRTHGVWIAQTPSLSVVSWGKYAFGSDEELVFFMAQLGYEIRPLLDDSCYEDAEAYAVTMPSFPKEGSIEDVGSYIIVHF